MLASEEFISERMLKFYRQTGPTITLQCLGALKSLETLGLRVDRQASNAARLADWLESHGRQCRIQACQPPQHAAMRQMENGGLLAFTLMATVRLTI